MDAGRGTVAADTDVKRHRASVQASRLALLVTAAATLVSLLGSLLAAMSDGGWIPFGLYSLIGSVTPPLFALAYWWLVSRWESDRSIREHRGAAALLVAIAVLVTVFSWTLADFSPFYAVFLFLVGARTRIGGLPGYGFLAALASFATGALPLPFASVVFAVFAAACVLSAWRLRNS